MYVGCVSIDNPSSSPNTDGVDPDSSSDVLIEHAEISVGDDCIAVVSSQRRSARVISPIAAADADRCHQQKSGWGCYGYRPGLARPSRDIVVRDLRCSSPTAAGLCIGSVRSLSLSLAVSLLFSLALPLPSLPLTSWSSGNWPACVPLLLCAREDDSLTLYTRPFPIDD